MPPHIHLALAFAALAASGGAIAATLRRYGAAALAARRSIEPAARVVRFTIRQLGKQ